MNIDAAKDRTGLGMIAALLALAIVTAVLAAASYYRATLYTPWGAFPANSIGASFFMGIGAYLFLSVTAATSLAIRVALRASK